MAVVATTMATTQAATAMAARAAINSDTAEGGSGGGGGGVPHTPANCAARLLAAGARAAVAGCATGGIGVATYRDDTHRAAMRKGV